jgi:hypothetical protein
MKYDQHKKKFFFFIFIKTNSITLFIVQYENNNKNIEKCFHLNK